VKEAKWYGTLLNKQVNSNENNGQQEGVYHIPPFNVNDGTR
jgi:hypothetical protein